MGFDVDVASLAVDDAHSSESVVHNSSSTYSVVHDYSSAQSVIQDGMSREGRRQTNFDPLNILLRGSSGRSYPAPMRTCAEEK